MSHHSNPAVSGSVDYDFAGTLPAGAKLVVELRDTSAQGLPSVLIARDEAEINADPPHSFRLEYNSRSVGEKNTYSLVAEVRTADNQLLFANDGGRDVITRGNPSRVSLKLAPTEAVDQLTGQSSIETPDSREAETEPVATQTVEPATASVDAGVAADEASGGGIWAVLLILVVVAAFAAILIARQKALGDTSVESDDEPDDRQTGPQP